MGSACARIRLCNIWWKQELAGVMVYIVFAYLSLQTFLCQCRSQVLNQGHSQSTISVVALSVSSTATIFLDMCMSTALLVVCTVRPCRPELVLAWPMPVQSSRFVKALLD